MIDLICPLCCEPLAGNPQGLHCPNRHQFDRAKEGYFNLLPVHHKNSREPGDAKQQLQARRAFLQMGYFSPLLEILLQSIPACAGSLLDIGCGEGYFTRGFNRLLPEANVYGLDIAKEAIRIASRQSEKHPESRGEVGITYLVASSHQVPLASSSMDVVTRIYAPSRDEELQRILRPAGTLIIVTPGEHHLVALRQRIYRELRPHPKPRTPLGFSELEHRKLSFPLSIPAGEFTRALLHMTPFSWRLQPALIEQIVASGLEDMADFQISSYSLA